MCAHLKEVLSYKSFPGCIILFQIQKALIAAVKSYFASTIQVEDLVLKLTWGYKVRNVMSS